MNSVQLVSPVDLLEEARQRFDHWRAGRSGKARTPEDLRRLAVSLLEYHRAFHICRALGINATALKRWSADKCKGADSPEKLNQMPAFVPLDATEALPTSRGLGTPKTPASRLTLELPGYIRVHCDSVNCASELLEALGVRSAMAGSR